MAASVVIEVPIYPAGVAGKWQTKTFSQWDIVKGSGYISGPCCGSSEMELGTAPMSCAVDSAVYAEEIYKRRDDF